MKNIIEFKRLFKRLAKEAGISIFMKAEQSDMIIKVGDIHQVRFSKKELIEMNDEQALKMFNKLYWEFKGVEMIG